MNQPLQLTAGVALLLVVHGTGCAGEDRTSVGGAGSGGGTSSTSTASQGGAGGGTATAGGNGGAGGGGSSAGGSGGACPDTCARDFPTVPSCQTAIWNTDSCTCSLGPAVDGSPCSDGDDCSLGDACKAGVCQKGPGAPSPESCQMALGSITKMPPGTTTIDFDTCVACACCGPGGVFSAPITNACVECSLDASFAAVGITRKGGSGTSFVSCITGNADAPMGEQALFVGGTFQPAPGTYGVELTFAEGVSFFGFAAAPTASQSTPKIVLEGYSADNVLVGSDTFDFADWDTGGCEVTNPAARFFGFRACCGKMTRVIATFTDGNAAMDSVSFF